ncbi:MULTISPECIES: hypothetical protein [Streptomyces]|uniref:Uncharacterized protein n=2 Tax=Streptomyces TaxID=1883 RepID=A0ABU4KF65_9ACTN|nr:hypothetical protein [Streptomyces roseolus]MDX2296396.1 hypothetical protein [Streptomyces roseolus]
MGLLSWLRGGRAADRSAEPALPAAPGDRWDVSEIPPIQRTLGAPVLVTDPSAFERGLPTRRPTALSTPLGHLISAEAPSGLVEGVATPVQRAVSVVEFPVRDGARPTASGAAPSTSPVTEVPGVRLPGAAPLAGRVQRAASTTVPAPAPDSVPGPVSVPLPAPPPPRAPSVPQPDTARGEGTPALQRTPEAPPEPAASQGAAEIPAEAADGPSSPAPSEGGAVEPSVRPLVGERPLLPAAPEPDAAPEPAAPPPVQRSLPPTGPPPSASPPPRRTPGLGAPLPGLPPTAQREAPGAAPAVPAPVPAAAPTLVRATTSVLPPLPAPTPAPEPEPVAPLLADRPLVLRTVASESAPDAGAPAAPPAVPVRWEAPAAVRRRPSPSPGPAPVQRVTARPVPTPPRPPRDAGDVAVAAGVAQRMADGSVVFAPPPPPAVHHRPALPSAAPFVQREVATEEPPHAPPEDVRAAAPEPVPDAEPEAEGAPASPVAGGTASTAPSGPSDAPPVTDEFVRALYPRLARLLKADLRLERERAGRLIDTRL